MLPLHGASLWFCVFSILFMVSLPGCCRPRRYNYYHVTSYLVNWIFFLEQHSKLSDELYFRFIFGNVTLKAAISFVSPWHSFTPTSECSKDHFFPRKYRIGKKFQLVSWVKYLKLLLRHTLTCSSLAESYHEMINNFTLERSAFKLFTVANLRFKISR